MKIKPLKRYSIGYHLLRCYVNAYYRIFYRRLHINGMENIPSEGPLIFTPNHQNALMDAMAIVCTIPQQPVFLARSDIFRKKWQAVALRFLRILPVYRMRDGYGTLKENDEVFDRVTEVLRNGGVIGIMPEGNHGDLKMLRQLKKGVLRIAFQAEESSEFKLGLNIVPVGIEFGDYTSFRSTIVINFGKPIDFSHLFVEYKENPQVAINKARDYLADHMRQYMIDVRNEENHQVFLDLWSLAGRKIQRLFQSLKGKLFRHYNAGKVLSEAINQQQISDPSFLQKLEGKFSVLREKLKSTGLSMQHIACKPIPRLKIIAGMFGLILLFPAWIYGLFNHIIPWWLIRSRVKAIEDTQFISSFKFVLSLLLFPAVYFVQFLIFGFIAGFLPALLYLISLPFSGFIAWAYLKWWKKLFRQYSYNRHYYKGNLKEILQQKDDILAELPVLIPELNA
jgi:1-acyl-sn-glycerol-3-phosphate acyltransferase